MTKSELLWTEDDLNHNPSYSLASVNYGELNTTLKISVAAT